MNGRSRCGCHPARRVGIAPDLRKQPAPVYKAARRTDAIEHAGRGGRYLGAAIQQAITENA